MNILITAGPTYERIDPVRFIGNFSTGKMGFALAKACADAGHNVTLLAGPVQLNIEHEKITRIDVESAAEMYQKAMTLFPQHDGAILSAAVADFTPVVVADQKIKKEGDELVIRLKPTQDIAASLGKIKQDEQFMVGFALETCSEEEHALEKMRRKNFDFIVLNSLRDEGAGFGYDTNKVTILHSNGEKISYPLKSKTEVALDILDNINKLK